MKSFAEVLEDTAVGDRHILLGNGFSQAWNGDIFRYENLLEKANFGTRNEAIKGIFAKLKTYDFEVVMKTMLASIFVSQSFNEYPAFVEGIRRDSECLKNTLITTISKNHPNFPYEISNDEYSATRIFLENFKNIFTVNYDLLLYWARNVQNLAPKDFETDDGFRQNRTWVGSDTRQDVFFLHGGLHIYDESGVIKKHAYTVHGETIIDQVRENLQANNFPIFVAEPDHIKKLDRIRHNPYLNFCYESLGKIGGSLIIFGHSMDETDTHIFNKVSCSNIENVYVSIYGDPASKSNRRARANAESYFSCPVQFYDAGSVQVWSVKL